MDGHGYGWTWTHHQLGVALGLLLQGRVAGEATEGGGEGSAGDQGGHGGRYDVYIYLYVGVFWFMAVVELCGIFGFVWSRRRGKAVFFFVMGGDVMS